MASSPEQEEEVITLGGEEAPENQWRVHCAATWMIRNFGCCQLDCGEELCSPMLSADSSGKVKWYLSIFPNGQENFEEHVPIHAVFIGSSEVPVDSLDATCRMSIVDADSNVWVGDRIDQKLSRFRFETLVRRKQLIEAKSRVLPQDTLTIRCHVSAFEQRTLEPETGSDDVRIERLRALADDFKQLYKSGKFSDVTLETRSGKVLAHKVILAARSPVFAELFREPRPTYPIPDFDKEAIDALMLYIYSGRVDPAAPAMSLDLHELAEAYQLRELTSALSPNQVFVRTEVTNDVFTYTWCVKNFSRTDTEILGGRHSETFHTGPSPRAWSLSLRFKKVPDDNTDRYLSVYLNKLPSMGDEKAVYIRLSVSLLGRDQQPHHTAEANRLYRRFDRHGFSSFVRRSALLQQREDLLPADTLTIRCDMKICEGASSSKVRHSFHSRDDAWSSNAGSLPARFRELLSSERGCDVTVCAPEREFRLHKPVLCARSTVFADFFDRYGDGLSSYTINIQGIRPEILEQLFTFVYTGDLEGGGPTCTTAPGLFAAADHYRIPGLKSACSEFIKSNACEVLVATSRTSDAKMRELVKDFVCSNADDVLAGDQWPELVRNHPRLASDVLKSLSHGYREAKKRKLD